MRITLLLVVLVVLVALIGSTGSLSGDGGGFGWAAPTGWFAEPAPADEPSGDALEASSMRDLDDDGPATAADTRRGGSVDRTESASDPTSSGPAASSFHQWIDDRGSVHFAASLDEVPDAWRERARPVELDPGAFTRAPSARPEPARRRPIAEVATASWAHDVTVYTAPWCGWCRKTIAFLDARGVGYVNKDIEADPRWEDELREKSGRTAIPFVEIDGHAIRGFDPGEMTLRLQ